MIEISEFLKSNLNKSRNNRTKLKNIKILVTSTVILFGDKPNSINL